MARDSDSADALASSAPSQVTSAALRRRRRRVHVAAWSLLVVTFLGEAATVLRAHRLWFLNRMPDDAYYYLEIATRLARGEGSTFDGINATNGYHPLWEALLVPLALLSRDDALIRRALLLGLALCFLAVVIVVHVVSRVTGTLPAVVGGIFAAQWGIPHWVDGMESPVVLLAWALLLLALERALVTGAGKWCVLAGIVSSSCVLARFDNAIVVLAVPLVLWWKLGRRAMWHCLGAAVAIAVPFGLWWWAQWGHVLTVSATVKAHWASEAADRSFGGRWSVAYVLHVADAVPAYLRDMQGWILQDRAEAGPILGNRRLAFLLGLVVLGMVTTAVATAVRTRGTRPRTRSNKGAIDAVAVVVGLLSIKALIDVAEPGTGAAWYSSPQRLMFGMAIGTAAACGARHLWRVARPIGVVACAALALVVVPVTVWTAVEAERPPEAVRLWQYGIDDASTWILEHGPEGRYGALDAGLVGYRLDGHRELVNLDGLVNSYGFVPFAERDTPWVVRIAESRVDYVVNRVAPSDLEQLACGTVIWRSSVEVPFGEGRATTTGPVAVVDVRHCRGSARS